jgi:hypothetical protein
MNSNFYKYYKRIDYKIQVKFCKHNKNSKTYKILNLDKIINKKVNKIFPLVLHKLKTYLLVKKISMNLIRKNFLICKWIKIKLIIFQKLIETFLMHC